MHHGEEAGSKRRPIFRLVDGVDEEAASREAWALVAEGYVRALKVVGLASFEASAMRASLLAALRLAQLPVLSPVRSPDEDLQRSHPAG